MKITEERPCKYNLCDSKLCAEKIILLQRCLTTIKAATETVECVHDLLNIKYEQVNDSVDPDVSGEI